MNEEVTIYDLAKALNLSTATVSRGLRDFQGTSRKTKKRIMDMAEAMGYRANPAASSLRTKSTNNIGVIVPRLDSYFMATAIAGMEKVATEAGYNLIISQSLESLTKEIANVRSMYNSRVDGLLISLCNETPNTNHLDVFLTKGIPLLFFDRVYHIKNCPAIVIDNFKAAYEVTTHLIHQGCTRIAHVSGDLRRNVYSDRFAGYKKALEDNGLKYNDSMLIINFANHQLLEDNDIVQRLLTIRPRPDGVFITKDATAAHCIRTLKKAGISIPEDMAIAGFNNDPICLVVDPSLTTMSYPGYEMGEIAAQTMINHLSGDVSIMRTESIVLRSELIIRESSNRKGTCVLYFKWDDQLLPSLFLKRT